MKGTDLYSKVAELLSEANISAAIDALISYKPTSSILQIAARFKNLEKDYRNGVISSEFHTLERNKISQSLLSLISSLSTGNEEFTKKKKRKRLYLILIFLLGLAYRQKTKKVLFYIGVALIGILVTIVLANPGDNSPNNQIDRIIMDSLNADASSKIPLKPREIVAPMESPSSDLKKENSKVPVISSNSEETRKSVNRREANSSPQRKSTEKIIEPESPTPETIASTPVDSLNLKILSGQDSGIIPIKYLYKDKLHRLLAVGLGKQTTIIVRTIDFSLKPRISILS